MTGFSLLALTLAWFVTGFSGAMMPGPISTMALVEGSRQGFRAGPLITLGHAIAELVMALALLVGLSEAIRQPSVAGWVGLVGGFVLLWMGADIIRSAWLGRIRLGASGPQTGIARLGLVPAGALTSLVNPYWLLWWATVGSAALLKFLPFGVVGIAAFYFGHILSDLLWNSFLAAVVSSGRRVISASLYRGVLVVSGAFLMLISAWFVWSGVGFLRG